MARIPPALAVFPPANGPLNFARDEAMLARARSTGREWIRIYTWDGPVVSFGRHERAAARFSAERMQAAGIGATRRLTGGRALLHHHELTYAISGPAADGDSLRGAYARVGELLAAALRHLGIAAETATRRSAPPAPSDNAVCFASPAPGELIVDGRKLVASAQSREGGAYLQHGSILIENDQPILATLLLNDARLAAIEPPATLRDLLQRVPTPGELADAISAAATSCWSVVPERVSPDDFASTNDVNRLMTRYLDPNWTWRR